MVVVRRVALLGAAVVLAACTGGDGGEADTAAPTSSTTAVVAPTTTTSTTIAASSTTSSSTTTTLVPTTSIDPAALLELDAQGLGTARFGADAAAVIDYVRSMFGEPTGDTGAVPASQFGACPGTVVRTVSWHDLSLSFGDEGSTVPGRLHLFAYMLGPRAGEALVPDGLHTTAGVGVGTGVAQLAAVYPNGNWSGPNAAGEFDLTIEPGLVARVDGNALGNVVVAIAAGHGCHPAAG